jgi:transposase-like protein
LLHSSGRAIAAVAKEIGVSDVTLAAWAKEQAMGKNAEAKTAAEAERKEAIELALRISAGCDLCEQVPVGLAGVEQ